MSVGSRDGALQLTGGRADPNGRWEYGRIEFQTQGFFRGLQDLNFLGGTNDQVLGRRGAQAACQELGHTAGVEVIAGVRSALPGPAGTAGGVRSIVCLEGEERLSECSIFFDDFGDSPRRGCGNRDDCNAAVLCATPEGNDLCYEIPLPSAMARQPESELTCLGSRCQPASAGHLWQTCNDRTQGLSQHVHAFVLMVEALLEIEYLHSAHAQWTACQFETMLLQCSAQRTSE